MFATVVLLSLASNPSVGVMDFGAEGGASADLASGLSTMVTQELERLGVFRVTSAQATRVMLGLERQRQLMGCDGCSGANLADLTSFDYVVSGKVVKTSGELTLLMSVIPVGKATAASSTRVRSSSDSSLMTEVGPAVVKLVGKLLEGRQGATVIAASERGAAVKVDDTQVGTTPLWGPQKLAGGPHLVSVEKEGFTASRREVRVVPDQVGYESFVLVPSPDTINEYEARTGRLRALAWTATGLAVVGAVFFAVGQFRADAFYGSPTEFGTFLFHKARLDAGYEVEGTVDHRQGANDTKAAVQTWQAVSVTGLGVGAAAVVAATVLFIVGDPPDKYSSFHAGLSISPGNTGFAVSGAF